MTKPANTLARMLREFFSKAGAPTLEDWQSTTKQKLTKYKAAAGPR